MNVPEVFPPLGVNTAPEGRGAAVREPIASPSGSVAVTENVRSVPSDPDAVVGAVAVGARSTFAIEIVVVSFPESALEAVNTTS